ncbi:17512_t:CDS:2, partial [Gigaspora margarita]
NSNIDMERRSNFLPSTDQLSALAKGCIPENTIKNTEGWIKIMNQWRLDVNYKEPLENLTKDMIELQVSQFLCGVTTKHGKPYSRTLLKNALSAINWHLQNVKPGLGESKSTDGLTTEEIQQILNHENLDSNTPLGLLKRGFFWISILGATRGGEHVNLHTSQIADTPDGIILRKNQQKNDQGGGGIEGNQFDLVIPFPSDPQGDIGPNSDIRKRTSIMELLSIGVPENTGRTISGHKSSGGYYAYAKPTDNHKREALANVLNKLITTTPSKQTAQDLIECTGPNHDSDIDYDASNIVSESEEYLSDNDNDSQNLNEQEFHGNFHTAQEVLNKNVNSQKRSFNITNNQENKRLHSNKNVTIIKKYYNNCTFNN